MPCLRFLDLLLFYIDLHRPLHNFCLILRSHITDLGESDLVCSSPVVPYAPLFADPFLWRQMN
jgi:hypothetical protein